MRSCRDEKGFTLVEIIIVVVIVGILASVGIPSLLSYFPKARLSGATRVVAGDLMATRMQAIKLNRTAYMQQTGSSQYQIAYPGVVLKSRDLSDDYSDVTISNWSNTVFFNSRGAAASPYSISLTNPSGTKTVDVTIAGRVKIN